MSVLTRACQLGNYEAVKFLLAMRVDVNAIDGKTPSADHFVDAEVSALHMACDQGHEKIARTLIEHGADINLVAQDRKGEKKRRSSKTPLQAVVWRGHASIVRLLIEPGAEIDSRDHFGNTALSIASQRNDVEIVEELLRARATIASPSLHFNALAKACRSSRLDVVELFLEELSGTPVETYACDDALSSAALGKEDVIFQLLIERGSAPSPSTLFQACAAGFEGSVSRLLDSRIDVDSADGDGSQAMHAATFERQPHIVELLLRRGSQINRVSEKYGTPLQAVLEGFIQYYPRGKPKDSDNGMRLYSQKEHLEG